MTAREYLQKIQEKHGTPEVTFIIAHSVKDSHSPFYHYEYDTTPVYSINELLRYPSGSFIDTHLVVNADHPPIDITGIWVRHYNRGYLRCAVLETEDDLRIKYSGKQAEDMIAYYKREVTEV